MIDRLDSMRLLVRVIERGSFTAAASDMNIPRSTATDVIKRLESDLGTRLLERTTRHVAATLDGAAYYKRCLAILSDVEEAEDALRGNEPAGLLRIDAHGTLTRTFLLPQLHDFMTRYPKITLQLGQGNRFVDLVREGVDCVVRAGEPDESGMIMRKLPSIPKMTCASPEYLKEYGTPNHLDDLPGHQMIGVVSSRTGVTFPLEFETPDGLLEISLPSRIVANDAETVHHLARLGFGLVQAPRYRFREDLAAGRLIEVLPETPPPPLPLAVYYPQNRQLSPRVRVFVEWVSEVFRNAHL